MTKYHGLLLASLEKLPKTLNFFENSSVGCVCLSVIGFVIALIPG